MNAQTRTDATLLMVDVQSLFRLIRRTFLEIKNDYNFNDSNYTAMRDWVVSRIIDEALREVDSKVCGLFAYEDARVLLDELTSLVSMTRLTEDLRLRFINRNYTRDRTAKVMVLSHTAYIGFE